MKPDIKPSVSSPHLVLLVGKVYPQHAHSLKNKLHGGQEVV